MTPSPHCLVGVGEFNVNKGETASIFPQLHNDVHPKRTEMYSRKVHYISYGLINSLHETL